MIGTLEGTYKFREENQIIIDVGGVGYAVGVPDRLATRLRENSTIRVYVLTHLRENALELYGFESLWEKRVFLLLTSVSGIGPRTAMGMLGALEPEQLLSAIAQQDRVALTAVSGIGKKMAERLLVELGEKARRLWTERNAVLATETAQGKAALTRSATSKEPNSTSSIDRPTDRIDQLNEAVEALVALGYREAQAVLAVRNAAAHASGETDSSAVTSTAPATALSTAELVRRSLKTVGSQLGN